MKTAVLMLLLAASRIAPVAHAQAGDSAHSQGDDSAHAQSDDPAHAQTDDPDITVFFDAASSDPARADAARAEIAAAWRDGYAAMLVDLLDLLQRTGFVSPESFVRMARLAEFLEEETGQDFGADLVQWRQWVWSLPYDPHPKYGEFKGLLYSVLQREFANFFPPGVASSIRLDEIQWGGVPINGIPPLDHPTSIQAADAGYLADDNVVFGVFFNGEARAYPKRILAWHELALDRVGGREITLVYCTLCGTAIPYDSEVGGKLRKFGTSGFLYRSNKLMFDAETLSLWSSLTGTPAVGPLVGSGLTLTPLPIVTTTWGEWRAMHPQTTVLSLQTGYSRDYSEGAAYRAYFATDALMFDVSLHDARLANKAEVLVLRAPAARSADAGAPADAAPPAAAHRVDVAPSAATARADVTPRADGAPPEGGEPAPVAISADFLLDHPVFPVDVGGREFVVVTSEEGANRVYAAAGHRFERREGDRVLDAQGRAWIAREEFLEATFDDTLRLPRVPAHRAFWFGWYAQHPDTELIR